MVLASPPAFVEAYYRYCQRGILDALSQHQTSLGGGRPWLVLLEHLSAPPRQAPVVLLQLEHTLVLPGGRDAEGAVEGSVDAPGGHEKYLARLVGGDASYARASSVIDYSAPNIQNILRSSLAASYAGRAHYVAPLLTTARGALGKRSHVVVATMHGSPDSGRRGMVKEQLRAMGIDVINISNVWADYEEHFDQIAVLLNVHQTPHHHSLEELRVLPAILREVVVVSEEFPLQHELVYGDVVLTSALGELAATVRRTVQSYEDVWDALYGDDRARRIEDELVRANSRAFSAIAKDLQGQATRAATARPPFQ